MNEHEIKAIKWIKEKTETIIKGFEELDQYRSIGTVEECKIYKELCEQSNLVDISKYREIGTIDECHEAVEKQRAKKADT